MSRRSLVARFVLSAFVTVVALEAASWLVAHYLGGRGIVYNPVPQHQLEAYARERDPLLGWPSPARFGRDPFDSSGSRLVPAFPDPSQPACVSLYGDSFTWGTDVSHEAAWGNRLARSLGCRVANFGQPGYATDQSFLRFQRNTGDEARTVILGYLSENLARNLTRLFNLLYRSPRMALKPRFVLGTEDQLQLVPMPELGAEGYRELLERPELYLDRDCLLPGGPMGPVRARLPRLFTVSRACFHHRIRARLRGEPYWAALYRADHPSRALQITERLMQVFSDVARSRGKRSLVLLFPYPDDLERFQRTGEWFYQPLMDRLQGRSIPFLNLGEGLAEHLGEREAASIFNRPRGGHLNEEGNEVVADLVRLRLVRDGGAGGVVASGCAAE